MLKDWWPTWMIVIQVRSMIVENSIQSGYLTGYKKFKTSWSAINNRLDNQVKTQ
jgi:hypothetical protein